MRKYFLVKTRAIYIVWIILWHLPFPAWPWGFFAHKQINRYAITTLPPDMFAFYKAHLTSLTERSVNPDKRRYVVQDEACKHFIDIEIYGPTLLDKQKLCLDEAIAKHGDKVVKAHGTLPWVILDVHQQLTGAFRRKDTLSILKLSADLGHYIADAHVPLHTTENYNGQITGQEGIHALWETRLPLLFFDTYNLFVGQSVYIKEDLLSHIWDIILTSHALVDKILALEKELSVTHATTKYSFEQDGNLLKKQYSVAFAAAYHEALQGQVEVRLQQSIIEVGNFWLTAWMNAGSPNLNNLKRDIAIDHEADNLMQEAIILDEIRTCNDE